MFKSALKHFPLILVIVVSFTFVGFALAHEGHDHSALAQVDVDASAQVDVSTQPNSAPVRPLDLARQKAMELKQNANANAKMQLRAGNPGEAGNATGTDRVKRERASSTPGLIQKIRNAVHQHAGLIKQRFALALRQFEQLTGRIETRIDKMKAAGIATASVEAELEVAKTAAATAKTDVEAVGEFVAGVEDSADRAAVRIELQALTKKAQTSIRTAHQALQKTIKSLVALAKENKPKVDASASVEAEAGAEATNQ